MKNESESIVLLNYIYQTSEMGVTGIDNLENKIKDLEFKDLIKKQRMEYKNIMDSSIEIFIKYGQDEKEIGKLAKITNSLMTAFKVMTDDSTSNLTKMMIEGTNKGILEITEELNKYNESDEEIKSLAEKLLKIMEHNIEELKAYL